MDFAAGTRLGPYEILAPIGAGGMGEVFRARDIRLDRTVAIKVLPSDAMADSARKKRLLQEARAASALNHANIVTVHDISSDGGIDFLVMEYVPGSSLKDLLRPEGLPLSDVLSYGTQTASALAAAHSAYIVHRDIKPANIMITLQGQVKVLDFGVAKLNQRPEERAAETRTQFTTPGTVIGTLSYMSPEQTRGEEVDGRSDIFSLGVVLYEAATGRLPFQGQSGLAVMHEIAVAEPTKASTVNKRLPKALDQILSRALAKERMDRFGTADELGDELRKLGSAQSARRKAPVRLVAYAGSALTVLGLTGWWVWQQQTMPPSKTPPLQPVTNFTGGGGETGPSGASSPALSSDGKLLAFIHDSQVWVKLLPSGEPTQLTRDQSPKFDPAFSPDGGRIAYSTISPNNSWDTWVVPALGGEPRLWLPNASGLSWTSPETVMFSEIKTGIHMAVVAATASRTESREIYVPPEIRGMAHRSYLSPDRKWVLLAEMDRGSWLPCRVVPADGSSRGTAVGPPRGQCTNAAWAPGGRWMYLGTNASGEPQIWRERFPGGAPEQLTFGPSEAQGVAVAPDGKSLITGIGFVQHSIVFHDDGGDRPITTQGDSIFPAWGDGFPTSLFSPDRSKLYYLLHSGVTRAFGGGELWVHDFGSESNQPLLPGLPATSFDVSPDGDNVVFGALDKDSVSRLWLARVDRRAPPRRIFSGEGMGPVFGDGGEVYFRGPEASQWFVFALNPDSGVARKLIAEPSVDAPAVSPDRKWVVVTVPFEGRDSTNRVKAFRASGGDPLVLCQRCFIKWTRDQNALFVAFRTANAASLGETIVFPISAGQAFPKLPEGGLTLENARTLPGAKVIGVTGVFPGIHASQYAYVNSVANHNLYRLALPR
jgi:eukaryotic-like serine/threonine-protein kinase